MPDIFEFLFCMALCALPTALCVLVWRKSPLVCSARRVLAGMGVVGLVGWTLIGGSVLLLPYFPEYAPDNGFASFCALVFGWAYVWVLGIPIMLFSFLLRCCFNAGWWVRRKVSRREVARDKPVWGVVILLFASLIAYPYLLTRRPEAQWHDWGERQYRIQREDSLVHVEIREGEDVWNVDTRASAFSRYAVEESSKDELLLKSTDIGNWLIGKQGGCWRVYVRENGEIRCIDNEILRDERKQQ